MGAFRDAIVGFCYKHLLKKILFLFDAEQIHDWFIAFGRFLGKHRFLKRLTALCFGYQNPQLKQDILGIKFKNPVGLAAGFDKEAYLWGILPGVGFGFEEVGSITGEPCQGNKKPRLWRLPKSKSLMVYYGLKNNGCEEIAGRLEKEFSDGRQNLSNGIRSAPPLPPPLTPPRAGGECRISLGINIAKTNSPATDGIEAGIADYLKAYRACAEIGDYFTVNISCPNTTGGEPFLQPENLDSLLTSLDEIKSIKPVFVKFSPDLSQVEVDVLLEVMNRHQVQGIICSNLTKKRNGKIANQDVPPAGGFSGKVVEDLANNLIKYVYQKTRGKYIIIGCGGIFSAKDAYKKIRLGASLVQLITGMIYEGPQLIGQINRGLVKLLEKDHLENISQAVGLDNRL